MKIVLSRSATKLPKRFCYRSGRKITITIGLGIHKAYYSLDRNDGIENRILHTEPSPEEILMQKVSMQQLYEALDHLPPIQARRVYAHYILGMKKVEIARAEGVNSSGVCDSVRKGVRNLRRYFEKKKWME